MDIKLSSIQEKINQSQSPLPLFTCLHVKPDVSELMFAGKLSLGGICIAFFFFFFFVNVCVAQPNVPLVNSFSHVMTNRRYSDEYDHMQNSQAVLISL